MDSLINIVIIKLQSLLEIKLFSFKIWRVGQYCRRSFIHTLPSKTKKNRGKLVIKVAVQEFNKLSLSKLAQKLRNLCLINHGILKNLFGKVSQG